MLHGNASILNILGVHDGTTQFMNYLEIIVTRE